MKRFACILALVSSVALLPNSAQASIMVSFPSASSTSTASAGEYFFNPSHTVEETFVGTGLASVDSLDLALDLDVNVLNSGAFVDFDVLLNGVTVGAFTFNEGDALGVYNFGFSFASILGAGTYTIKLQVNNTVADGEGSVGFSETNSFATLDQNVPEPGAIAIWSVLGLVGLGIRRRQS